MQDEIYIQRCLEIAAQGNLYTAPNPMVGCVIVYDGEIVAEGYHQKYGEGHAEVNAFKNLSDAIDETKCDVYVNLEPCSHFGKTPPCSDLIIDKKPRRVIIGMLDPHVKVAGKGLKMILETGIDVKVGVLEEKCKALNKKFIKAHAKGMPYMTLKWAETRNGFMASATRQQKISDARNDEFVHHLRATHQAILVGAGTIAMDSPILDVRHSEGNSPLKVVLSKSLSVDLTKAVFTGGKQALVYNSIRSESVNNYELISLEDLSLKNILKDLHSRGIQSVLVEGGPTILQAFLDQKMWDEAIVLKSGNEWQTGTKAPWVGIPSIKEERQHNDLIKYFNPT